MMNTYGQSGEIFTLFVKVFLRQLLIKPDGTNPVNKGIISLTNRHQRMLTFIFSKLKFLIVALVLLLGCLLFMFAVPAGDLVNAKAVAKNVAPVSNSSTGAGMNAYNRFTALYSELKLDSLQLSAEAFAYGLQGYRELLEEGQIKNNHILSIVDFSLPSSKKRLFVIDLECGKLLFNTLVSHGRNSGTDMATRFSNNLNSYQSSLGFYVTGDTYKGEHGYSLRLDGKEEGINDKAYTRSIVMHAANYVNESVVKMKGYLGRSLGCPAIPPALHKAIINTIKDGSCLFVYSPDTNYTTHSKLIG